ncbi:translation initiation factor IF-2-like isoform X2 [Zalophus californianus]|uniref:Translation initiation factor IF-2-like isoform X2 n=1 Tax=Zalophus californianus TaxID=9704 RepID=A0A6J2FMF5_ZALCA|nr:translation initiation factor IF-2-like isoform X2 [Zalophus californianus]
MAPRGEGAPSFSLARRPGRSGPRPSLASDPALRCGAARGPCTPAGAGKRGRWAGESGGAGGRGSGAEPRWREPEDSGGTWSSRQALNSAQYLSAYRIQS